MPPERVPLTPRQWSVVGLVIALLLGQGVAYAVGAPTWVVVPLVILESLALVLAVVTIVPLARRGR